jgi:hypothetical protein
MDQLIANYTHCLHTAYNFNNTKTDIAWNKAAGKKLNATIDELCGERYREAHIKVTEAGMRKAMDYIMKTCYSMISDVHYEIEKGFNGIRADGVLFYGEKFSLENVKNGSCKILGIMEYKKSSIIPINLSQVMAYLSSVVGAQPEGATRLPEVLMIGKNIKKENKQCIEGFRALMPNVVVKTLPTKNWKSSWLTNFLLHIIRTRFFESLFLCTNMKNLAYILY